jgi:dipeptidyl aminopeptidase/acylaminoacyl peptidase
MSIRKTKHVLACSALALHVVALFASSRAFAQAPSAEAFAALPSMQSPALSPDGTQLAFITQSPAGSYIVVSNLESMAVTTVVDTGDVTLRTVSWASDDALLFDSGITTSLNVAPGRLEQTFPYGVDLTAGAKVTRLLREGVACASGKACGSRGNRFRNNGGGAQLVGYERRSGRLLYPKSNPAGDRVLYAVDPKNDRSKSVDVGAGSTLAWVVDEAGKPVFRVDRTEQRDRFSVLASRGKRWEPVVAETAEIPQLSVYGLNAEGDLVVGARPKQADRFGLYSLSTETGEIGKPILTDDRYDVATVRIDPYTNRVVGASMPEGPVWLDEEIARQQKLIDEAFPGESPVIVSWSEDRSRMLVITQGESRPPAVYVYEPNTPSLNQIANEYAGLQGVSLPARRAYSYTAQDGTSIPAYLTRPLDADGPTPLIVLPHGGPAARDVGGFDWMAHFLATRGYTVLQPNFRGSGGSGQAWERAGYGQWGIGVAQQDLTDGVAALVEAGLADPDRVCIVGASYGGYAALAGAVFTPKLYACAAAIAPIADPVEMLGGEPNRRGGGFNAAVGYWRRAMRGAGGDNLDDRLLAASPAAHAEQDQAPVLLIHGRDDSVVPFEQSQSMERALSAAGKPVELVELEDADHWLSAASTRLATLQALERFLGEHLSE